MFNLDKRFNKEELEKLLKSKYGFLIAEWYCIPENNKEGRLADYYVSNLHKLTDEEQNLMDKDKLEVFNLLKAEELSKITKIAHDNLSFKLSSKDNNYKEVKLKNLKEIINYDQMSNDINRLLINSYLAGICSLGSYLLRHNSVDREDTIDDIFNVDNHLFL